MDINNPLYKNQSIHVDAVVFTVEDKEVKILLVKRGKEPFVGKWVLPGGVVYNNESVDYAAKRELEEKTGLNDLFLEQFHTFSDPKRDPRMRMISVAYLALIDKHKVSIQQKTEKTLDAEWFEINKIPKLAFDHNEIINFAVKELRDKLINSNIAYEILPKEFTLAQIHLLYETILATKLDRRNFRRKLLNLGLIEPTGKMEVGVSNRPGQLYHFKNREYLEMDIV